jgi:hypothetical protein
LSQRAHAAAADPGEVKALGQRADPEDVRASSPTDHDGISDLDVVEEPGDVGVREADAAMGRRTSEPVLVVGAVQVDVASRASRGLDPD